MERTAKLNALRHIAMTMNEGPLIPLLGFLAGRLDLVHFVSDTSDSTVSIKLSLNTLLWPRIPFRASIDGTAINNPIAFIDLAALRDDEVHVKVETASDIPEWLQAVVEEEVLDPREALHASIQEIRTKIDLALDAYRTANEKYPEADADDRRYLKFVFNKAKEEMRVLNGRLSELEQQMGSVE